MSDVHVDDVVRDEKRFVCSKQTSRSRTSQSRVSASGAATYRLHLPIPIFINDEGTSYTDDEFTRCSGR
jgi:hypothetical protein